MLEFTQTLDKIMSIVSNQLELLPASEGAVGEMTYVDEEERVTSEILTLTSRNQTPLIASTP